MADVFESGEYSISGGSGQIKLTIPINLAVTAIGFMFKGISIAGSYPATAIWNSGYSEVSNGGSSPGGYPCGATAAGCFYTGISKLQAAGPGYLIETKTGNCSNNYGGSVAGPLNNGQTGSSSMGLPSGNISHSIGGSGKAGFQYRVQYTYQQAYEIKTSNVQASCGGFSCGYSVAINNGSWVLPYSGNDAWIRMDPLAFQPGNTATINISVGGSQKCGVKVAYEYTRARPLLLNTLEIRKGPTTTYALPVVDPEDINLDLDSYVQALVPTSPSDPTPIIRCVDLVEVDDGDAGPVRINTHHGSKAVRKWQG